MCTGRVDLAFMLRAFRNGADGVIIGGCWPGECHYVTEGNMHALANVHLARMMLRHMGVNPDRLRIEWISAAEGNRFAEVMSDFAGKLRKMGALGKGEGKDVKGLRLELDAALALVPYIKLVERERLRVPSRTEAAINEFYASDEVAGLVRDLIVDRIATSQIMALVRARPVAPGEISRILGIAPSDVSRHLDASARQGLVRFDGERDLVVPTQGSQERAHG